MCRAAPAADTQDGPAHAVVNALTALRVDPHSVFPVRNVDIRRDAIHLTLVEGQLAFLEPYQGKITGAVFTGRGHILALPRDITEKASLGRFLGAPILDQNFARAYFRFDDNSAAELLSDLQKAGDKPIEDSTMAEDWNPVLVTVNPWHSLRLLEDLLSEKPKPYFYAGLVGYVSGAFDAMVDDRRDEQVLIAQPKTVADHELIDAWASFTRAGAPEDPKPLFQATDYSIESVIQPDLDLAGTATFSLQANAEGERIVPLELSQLLRLSAVSDESGRALEFFQSEPSKRKDIAEQGDDAIFVVLAAPTRAGETIHLKMTYQGRVISDAGNGVFFVGQRGSWYPHPGGTSDFSNFHLKFRWPKQWTLVATGRKMSAR
ncbi:MAG: hypothetical protein ACRD5L_13450, partial [Bryobacteraceae bacterium]